MKRVLSLLLLFSVAVASYAATDYGIAVAGVRVTSANKDNITGTGISGSVSYNFSTNTLTLNNATIDVRAMAVNAITNDYGSRANFKIKLVGNNIIKINASSIAINVKESQGFELYSSGNDTGTLTCDGALYLDARDHMTNDYTMSTIWNCTVRFDDIISEDYEECLTINNANVTTDYLNVGSDHNGQKGLKLIDCYLAYPVNGVVGNYGTIMVDGDSWEDHVEIKRGARHGDVNGDGDITAADVTALYDWLLNNDNTQLKYGDQNGDGDITAADVTEVYDVLLGNYNPYGHEWVDLGLPSGTLWATMNIGANSPEDYGDYFAWGETTPKEWYDWSTYKWCNGKYNMMTKYCTDSSYGYNGFTDNKTELDLEDDAACFNWGYGWRIPSKEQMQELIDNCSSRWTTMNGVYGRLLTGPNGATMFLPAAGKRWKSEINYTGTLGNYWSNKLYSSSTIEAYYIDFDNVGNVGWGNYRSRSYGMSIRAVRVSNK